MSYQITKEVEIELEIDDVIEYLDNQDVEDIMYILSGASIFEDERLVKKIEKKFKIDLKESSLEDLMNLDYHESKNLLCIIENASYDDIDHLTTIMEHCMNKIQELKEKESLAG